MFALAPVLVPVLIENASPRSANLRNIVDLDPIRDHENANLRNIVDLDPIRDHENANLGNTDDRPDLDQVLDPVLAQAEADLAEVDLTDPVLVLDLTLDQHLLAIILALNQVQDLENIDDLVHQVLDHENTDLVRHLVQDLENIVDLALIRHRDQGNADQENANLRNIDDLDPIRHRDQENANLRNIDDLDPVHLVIVNADQKSASHVNQKSASQKNVNQKNFVILHARMSKNSNDVSDADDAETNANAVVESDA